MQNIRNIAIIAHIDHGKTTLVDAILRQAGTFRSNQVVAERVMDSMDLEKEKGITIRAKNASFKWQDYHVNIVDTPGHADFGGEVERIMKMIDSVFLVVDAFDGPQAQTKFVLKKALEEGLRPVVFINKIDRENARPHKVLDMVFDLFLELNATDEQLDFPVLYGSAKEGFAAREWHGGITDDMRAAGMTAVYETIVKHVPPPVADLSAPFRMSVANLDYSDYVGRIAYGKIHGGKVAVGDAVVCLKADGGREKGKVTKIFSYNGLQQIELDEAGAGTIIGLSGLENVFIGETVADSEDREPLPFVAIDPPTIQMQFVVNDSPLAGQEGKFLTARHIWERLTRETRTNVSLIVSETETAGCFLVSARGEMQVAILVEQMRREGFELMVSRPEVIFHKGADGELLEPYETMYVDLPSENLGDVLQNLAERKGETVNMEHQSKTVLLEVVIPTRGLIGFETDLLNLTKGMGIMSHLFKEYGPHKGDIRNRANGVAIAMEAGETTSYALAQLQERVRLFVGPAEQVYEGMVFGENSRPDDMLANPCKIKHLTNMRSQGDGKAIQLTPPLKMSLERCLEYINADEYLEITPATLRMRKKLLGTTARRRAGAKV
ncbi:MAG: translational GTPase TypA [Verrucomicrobiales bacterium]|jgi:GTP-binding protein|nr:translational GTPase TypA [Verrucomicrobiales bacterium]